VLPPFLRGDEDRFLTLIDGNKKRGAVITAICLSFSLMKKKNGEKRSFTRPLSLVWRCFEILLLWAMLLMDERRPRVLPPWLTCLTSGLLLALVWRRVTFVSRELLPTLFCLTVTARWVWSFMIPGRQKAINPRTFGDEFVGPSRRDVYFWSTCLSGCFESNK